MNSFDGEERDTSEMSMLGEADRQAMAVPELIVDDDDDDDDDYGEESDASDADEIGEQEMHSENISQSDVCGSGEVSLPVSAQDLSVGLSQAPNCLEVLELVSMHTQQVTFEAFEDMP